MNGYTPRDVAIGPSTVIGASLTNQVISLEYPITAEGSLHHIVAIDASAVTVGTAITAKLQTAIGSTYVDSKTVAISGNGRFYIKLLVEVAGDQTFLPLFSKGRIVLTTGAGDTATITDINILQRD